MIGLSARPGVALQPTPYGRLVGAWIVTRLIALASIALTPRLLDDIDIYRGWLPYFHWEHFPLTDPKWQYPPGASVFLGAPAALPINYSVAFAAMCVILDAAIMAMLLLARSRREGQSDAGPRLWSVAALVVGPIMFTRFDIVPALFAVAFVLLVARPALAGVSAALGFLVKIWPALLLLALPRAATRRGVTAFVVATVASMALLALRFDGTLSFLGNQRARGLQVESTGALPYEIYKLFGGNVDFGLQYGAYQVLMSGAELVGTAISILGLVLMGLIAWWRLSGRLESVLPGDVAVAVILVSVASSRVYSPQYNTWIIALLAVALLASRSRMRPVGVVLVGVSVLTQFVYPWFPYDLTDGNWPIVAVQCLRIGGLLAATWLALRAISTQGRPAPTSNGIIDVDATAPEDQWTYDQESPSRSV
jgi:hypothetical protein